MTSHIYSIIIDKWISIRHINNIPLEKKMNRYIVKNVLYYF